MSHHPPPERADHIHLHGRLDPQGGGIQKEAGGMDEEYVGALQRPKENDVVHHTQLPLECMDPQNHETQRIQ